MGGSLANGGQPGGSESYCPNNFLDRISDQATLEFHYRHMMRRERRLVDERLGLQSGTVLSVGCGWHPGRHLFPAPAFRMIGVDADPDHVSGVLLSGRADEAFVGRAGHLDLAPETFDVVLYRLVLHHIVFHEALDASLRRRRDCYVPAEA